MSIRLMSLIFDSDFEPGEKLLLLALADFGNDDGKSIYPSQKTLSKKTSLTARHIRTISKKLEAGGILTRPSRSKKSGVYNYELSPEAISARVTPSGSQFRTPAEASSAPQRKPVPVSAEASSADPLDNHQKESLEEPSEESAPTSTPRNLLFGAIVKVCSVDLTVKGNRGRVAKAADDLITANPPYCDQDVLSWGQAQNWMTTPPSIRQLMQGIGSVRTPARQPNSQTSPTDSKSRSQYAANSAGYRHAAGNEIDPEGARIARLLNGKTS